MKIIDATLLNKVSAQAKDSPRLRMNYNFHQSLDEKCHRFLNAVEPGTKVAIPGDRPVPVASPWHLSPWHPRGIPVASAAFVEKQLQQDQTPLTVVDRLGLYQNIENDEFLSLCQEAEGLLMKNEMPNLYATGRAVAFMSLFHDERLYWMTEALVAIVKRNLTEVINNQTDKDQLYEMRASYLSGLQSVQGRKPLSTAIDITQYLEKRFNEKEVTLTSKMEQALMNLSNETVGQLETLDRSTAPNKQSEYSLTPIFHRLDAKALMDRIRQLNNEGKRTFGSFVTQHYLLYAYGDSTKQYEADFDVISALHDLVKEEIFKTQHVERYAYEYLQTVLDAAEKRCSDNRNALLN